jgi:hypothetical protein
MRWSASLSSTKFAALVMTLATALLLVPSPPAFADSYVVAIELTNANADLHAKAKLRGTASPAGRRVPVVLQAQDQMGKWHSVAKRRTRTDGTFGFSLNTSEPGLTLYRIKVRRHDGLKGTKSGAQTQGVYRWLSMTQKGSALDDDYAEGSATVAGVTYPQSVWATGCNMCDGQEDGWKLVTSARCTTVDATVGMKDNAGTDKHPVVTYYADGQQIWSKTLSYGSSEQVTLAIDKVLQLKITLVGEGFPTLGNGRVRCAF